MFETSLLFNSAEGDKNTSPPSSSLLDTLKKLWLPCLVISGIASVAVGLFIYRRPLAASNMESSSEIVLTMDDDELPSEMYVYISGAVERPGVYQATEGDRVDSVIAAAGGITDSADKVYLNSQLNLSLRLKDEQKIHIPFEGEVSEGESQLNDDFALSLTTTQPAQKSEGLTSINTATESELDSLPGVGPATVKKIIDGRPYTSLPELIEKKILSQSVYAEIQPLLNL